MSTRRLRSCRPRQQSIVARGVGLHPRERTRAAAAGAHRDRVPGVLRGPEARRHGGRSRSQLLFTVAGPENGFHCVGCSISALPVYLRFFTVLCSAFQGRLVNGTRAPCRLRRSTRPWRRAVCRTQGLRFPDLPGIWCKVLSIPPFMSPVANQ